MLTTDVPTYIKKSYYIVAIYGVDRELFRPPTYVEFLDGNKLPLSIIAQRDGSH